MTTKEKNTEIKLCIKSIIGMEKAVAQLVADGNSNSPLVTMYEGHLSRFRTHLANLEAM